METDLLWARWSKNPAGMARMEWCVKLQQKLVILEHDAEKSRTNEGTLKHEVKHPWQACVDQRRVQVGPVKALSTPFPSVTETSILSCTSMVSIGHLHEC